MFHQVQENPEYRRAVSVILALLQKYVDRAAEAVTAVSDVAEAAVGSEGTPAKLQPEVGIDRDPHLDAAATEVKILLGRLSSKPFLVDSIQEHLRDLGDQLSQDFDPHVSPDRSNDIQTWSRALREWGTRSLSDPAYTASDQSRKDLESLYDEFLKILHSEGPAERRLQATLNSLLTEVVDLKDSIADDPAIGRFLSSLAKLTFDAAYLTSISSLDLVGIGQVEIDRIAKEARDEIRRDIMGFVVPRLIRAVKVLPLPRLEFASPTVDVILDNLNLNSLSFLPDHLNVTNSSQLRFVGSDAAYNRNSYSATQKYVTPSTAVPVLAISQAQTRTKIHIDGLRISATDIAYYVNYKGPWFLGWKDSGLLSIEMGRPGHVGEGLKLEIELEMMDRDMDLKTASQEIPAPTNHVAHEPTPSSETHSSKPSFFKVCDVVVDIPGLTISIRQSRHWIFNSLCLQPLLEPVVREAIYVIARQQIRNALEELDQKLARASEAAKIRTAQEPSLFDYLFELVHSRADSVEEEDDDVQSETEETTDDETPVQKTTTVGLQGVVMRTHKPDTDAAEDSVLAVGIGEQVLRDVPLPEPSNAHERASNLEETGPALANEGRQAIDDLARAGEELAETAEEAVEEAEDVREQVKEEIANARVRLEDRKRFEKRRKGWRSSAFNF